MLLHIAYCEFFFLLCIKNIAVVQRHINRSVIIIYLFIELKATNANDILFFLQTFYTLMNLFLFAFIICNFGENVTSHFTDLSNEIYNLSWYLYPPKIQYSIKLLMLHLQQPIYIEGFAGIRCTHGTYMKVRCSFIECFSNNNLFSY